MASHTDKHSDTTIQFINYINSVNILIILFDTDPKYL